MSSVVNSNFAANAVAGGDSEGRTTEASAVSNGLASARDSLTRKTGGSDIGRLSSFGIRTEVLLSMVEDSVCASLCTRPF